MSHIKNLFFDEPRHSAAPFLSAPPVPKGLHSAWTEHEGVQLLLYFEFEPACEGSREPMTGLKLEPDYPATVTILYVYARDVDIMPLLPFKLIDELERGLLP